MYSLCCGRAYNKINCGYSNMTTENGFPHEYSHFFQIALATNLSLISAWGYW
jgi:hypothetical protein